MRYRSRRGPHYGEQSWNPPLGQCMAMDCYGYRWQGSAYCTPCEEKLLDLGWETEGDLLVVQNRDNYAENMKETQPPKKKAATPKSTPKKPKGKK